MSQIEKYKRIIQFHSNNTIYTFKYQIILNSKMSCFPTVKSRRCCVYPTQVHQPPVRYLDSHSIGPPYCIASPPQFVYGAYVSSPWERLNGCPHPFQTKYKQLVYLQVTNFS